MADVGSNQWFSDLLKWGATTSEKLLENALLHKTAPVSGTGTSSTGSLSSGISKWAPYALIGAALLAALFLFKGKK